MFGLSVRMVSDRNKLNERGYETASGDRYGTED